jgi:hypothetical protein
MIPQEINNHPQVIRGLGVIGINTALERDIHGSVNSTHVDGTHMMNGLGGSATSRATPVPGIFAPNRPATCRPRSYPLIVGKSGSEPDLYTFLRVGLILLPYARHTSRFGYSPSMPCIDLMNSALFQTQQIRL